MQFKPSYIITNEHSREDYRMGVRKTEWQSKTFNTYPLLKKQLRIDLMTTNVVGDISVSRSRRGEWGEYFEIWSLVNGKPKIIKQGWQ